jgi:hypothetical protein
MPVPWEINKLCYFYLLLKHYKLDEQPLPQDIVWLLATAFHDVCNHAA